MQFIDKALARRFEAVEEMPQVFYARVLQMTQPEIGAAEEEICGGHMAFAGLGSPIGRATGAGLDRPFTAEDIDRIEQFLSVAQRCGFDSLHGYTSSPGSLSCLDTGFFQPLSLNCCLRYLRLLGVLPRPGAATGRGAEVPMFFEIKDLELHPIEFAEKFAPGAIDLGTDYRQVTPIETSGRADLVEEHHGKHKIIQDIRVRGRLSTRLESNCARCLEPLTEDVKREFDLLYRPQGADAGRDEMSVTDAEAEISYYEGEGLPLDDVVREQVLLAVPLKLTCREDCKGLCPHCGKNLNQERCSCAVTVEEPRWAALKEIRGKLAH